MKVIVDWRPVYDPRGGMYRTFRKILPLLSHNHGCEFGFIKRSRKNTPPSEVIQFPFALPPLIRSFPEGRLKDLFWKHKVDSLAGGIFHTPYYSIPPSQKIPCVATFYDLITEIFREKNYGPIFDRFRERKAWLAKNSARLVAISESTKNDLCRIFQVNPDIVDTIPLGVDDSFLSPPLTATEITFFKKKWGVTRPFLLIVGGRDAHKNFSTFLESYATTGLKNDFEVIAAGEPWSASEKDKIAGLGVGSRIKNLAWPDDSELKALYESCAALVYPSRYEGFGLPPLEGMACGAPIALAAVSSLPEVAGEVGFYFDPASPADMARVIRLAAEAGRDSGQVKAGKARSQKFTWAETARLTAQTYLKAMLSS